MNKKYLVAYVITTTIDFMDINHDHYKVFIDYDDNKLVAQIFYEKLLLDEDTYSANICEILESTDY